MRVASFERGGRRSIGVVTGSGVVDAGAHAPRRQTNLRDVLAAGGLEELRALEDRPPDYGLDEIAFRPLVDDPAAKILCVGINYMPHIREMGRERPEYPVVFVRFANSLVGHEQPLVKPAASQQYDFEGELAVVIGKRASRVSRARAFEHVAGFSCFNDGSVRDYQRHGPQWTPGKNFRRSGAFGPWLVTADEQPDPSRFRLRTLLNGDVVQEASVGELCFDVPALIEYCSAWTDLEPGDVIATGTPGGVGAGRTPPLWMKPGDRIEVEISGVGRLGNTVVEESDG